MLQSYLRQLRADSSFSIVPVFTALTISISILLIALLGATVWYLIIVALLAALSHRIVRNLLKQENKQEQAGIIFIASYLVLLTIILVFNAQSAQILPYLFGIFILLTSTMVRPENSFHVWITSTFLIFFAIAINPNITASNAIDIVIPIVLNFLWAIVAFLTTTEWQLAVESVSILQRRAQARRDDLFEMKETLQATNNRLNYLNEQLDIARQQAINERDLRTRFMNNVSHELRTPLNAIVNFAHIIRLGGRGEVNEGQTDYLLRIEKSGWHLLDVLNDLLDMAQIQSGEFKLYLEEIDLYPICEDAMTNVRGLIMEKEGIEIIRDYPEEWPIVKVDQMRLKQALINLLGNAAKYTESGHIALRVKPHTNFVAIHIEDTGVGIAPEHHEDIFKEFRQVDESAARKRIGTGLGLPITRHLIEQHGGTITIDSEEERGSIFTISLPIAETESTSTGDETSEITIKN